MLSDITLEKLDYIFQVTMGWTNSHLHQFIILSAYDDLIENNTRRVAALEQMAE